MTLVTQGLIFDFMYAHERACIFITYVICNNVLMNSFICFKLEINIIQEMSPQIFHFIIWCPFSFSFYGRTVHPDIIKSLIIQLNAPLD